MKILIIEDETGLAADMQEYLASAACTCTHAASLADGREALALYDYDLLVVDVGLPDGSGLEILPRLREKESVPGVLILSAKDSLDDKLRGLDLGADDYLTKPFHQAELLSRLRSIYRRRNFGGQKSIVLEEMELFPEEMKFTVSGKEVPLTPREFRLLLFFLGNQNKVLSRAAIAEHLWGDQADQMDDFDFIYTHIRNLRKKIIDSGGKDRIESVYGVGYKFANA